MIRKQQILVGQKVWVEQFRDLDLPQGLRNGVRATVTAYDSTAKSVTIAGADGCSWTLDPIHLDTGWTFLVEAGVLQRTPKKPKPTSNP